LGGGAFHVNSLFFFIDLTSETEGRDINLDILHVEGYCKFCNKIYNATKFALLKLDKSFMPEPTPKVFPIVSLFISSQFDNILQPQPTGNESLVKWWILHQLNIPACDVNKHMVERNFMAATMAAHNFWLYELSNIYIASPVTRNRLPLKLTKVCLAGSHETCRK
jgi:valyl-tRNA synthetase